ncbi:MAG: hypothetical protein H6550_08435 [Chitinophagales bacterium]|nr:hypothetical protein [Chitinophagales bacterium]
MRYVYLIALMLLTGFVTFSHDGYKKHDDDDPEDSGDKNNYIEVDLQSSINFTVSQPSHFENKQTVSNAIKLKFKSKSSDCTVYAKASNYSTPSGANQNTIPIELEMRSNNAKKLKNVVSGPLQLTLYDQLLFQQSKDNSTNNFFYDVSLLPLGYDYPEGQYNFTILFTMTQP